MIKEYDSPFADLHTHTVFCDGKNTVTEMAEAAHDMGLCAIGFTAHAYTPFDTRYCIKNENIPAYCADIEHLRRRFDDKLIILSGIERDLYDEGDYSFFDYTVGSVHYIKAGDEYIEVDENEEILIDARNKYFGGDIYALIEEYYRAVSSVGEKLSPAIIGHFDLISKFNEDRSLFDPKNERYIKAWKKAVDALIPYNIPFEVNTGAISRGYRTSPYPADDILKYIKEKGGKVLLTGDTHAKENLCCKFGDILPKLEAMGFEPIAVQNEIIKSIT